MSTRAHPEMEPHRAQWNSKWGFLMAAVGSAVGLGNIWRFPYLCYENGGGAFLIPYFVALVTAGIPLLIMELGLGHKMRGSAPMSIAQVRGSWEWLGWWVVLFVMFGIVLYYSVIIAWCVCYVWFSFDLSWGADPDHFFFKEFLRVTEAPHIIGDVRGPILLGLGIVWVINWLVVFFGVQKGIERFNKVFMPSLAVLVLTLVAWTAMLPGAREGIVYYLTPDFSKLGDLKVWVDAYTQVFFSLSLGFGIMIAYASYLPRKADLTVSACVTALCDTALAFVAGFAVFGTLGYMVQNTGATIGSVVSHGIGLAFVTYPKAIGLLPGFKSAFGIVFFSALVIAGVTSSISIIEAFASAVIDKFHYPRRIVVTVLSFVGFVGSMIFISGAGLLWLDIVDHILSHYGLVLACFLECLLVGWVWGAEKLRTHVNHISAIQLSRGLNALLCVITPFILAVLVGHDLYTDLRQPYGGYSWTALLLIGVNWLVATGVVALFIAMQPWRKHSQKKRIGLKGKIHWEGDLQTMRED